MARFRRGIGLQHIALLSVSVLVQGCPVDDRTLIESGGTSSGGRGGTSGSGKGGAKSSLGSHAGENGGPAHAGGEAGQHGDVPGADGCADLNENRVPDCEETLVHNPDFGAGFSSWKPEPDISIHWVEDDASDSSVPGALALTSLRVLELDNSTTSGASQCVEVLEGDVYTLAAHLFIAKGQGLGSAGLGALFFDTTNCSGAAVGASMTALSSTVGTWAVTSGEATAPVGAQSMSLRLLTVKPFRQPSLEVLFDDVLMTWK